MLNGPKTFSKIAVSSTGLSCSKLVTNLIHESLSHQVPQDLVLLLFLLLHSYLLSKSNFWIPEQHKEHWEPTWKEVEVGTGQ